jgi:outer membrane protein OmpA-like peptidoglycan-associated protein
MMRKTRVSLLTLVLALGCGSMQRSVELQALDTAFGDPNRVASLEKLAPDAIAAARNFHGLADKAFEKEDQAEVEHYTSLAQLSWDTAVEREKIELANQRVKVALEKKKAADAMKSEQLTRKQEFEARVARMEKILALQNQEAKTAAEKERLEAELTKAREEQAKITAQAQAQSSALESEKAAAQSKLNVFEERKALFEDASRVPTANVKQEARGVVITLYDLFASAKTEVQTSHEYILQKVADLAAKYPDYPMLVEGYTDSRGRPGDNLALSTSRAQAVVNYLVSVGKVDFNRIKSAGYGEDRPVGDNSKAEGRAKNRRIEVVFVFR